MRSPSVVPGPWSRRIERAQILAERHPPAADILRFYARLADHQQKLSAQWTLASWDPPLVLEALPGTLDWIESAGPRGLASAMPTLREWQPADWRRALDRYLSGEAFDAPQAPAAFVVETLLQPLAESCAARVPTEPRPIPGRCPFCQHHPTAGVLRDAGQGTRRTLVCGLCFTEWSFGRIACPSCGERKFDELPVYTAEQVEGVRIEGCDTCGVYLKTIDASKDGTVVPVVDDLATITLDLWARDQGYRRLRPSLYL